MEVSCEGRNATLVKGETADAAETGSADASTENPQHRPSCSHVAIRNGHSSDSLASDESRRRSGITVPRSDILCQVAGCLILGAVATLQLPELTMSGAEERVLQPTRGNAGSTL